MVQNNHKQHGSSLVAQYGFKLLLYIITLFIFIGDLIISTARFVARICITIISTIGQSLWRTINSLFAIRIKLQKIIIGFPRIKLPRISMSSLQYSRKQQNSTSIKKIIKKKKLKPHTRLDSFFLASKFFIMGAIFVSAIVLFQKGYSFVYSLPNPRLIGNINYSVSTQIFDRNGKLLYDVYRDQNRTPVKINDLPQHVIQATLAIEDQNFYNHAGISPIGGILRAIKDSYRTGKLQGGSTITQQLVKTSLLTPERTYERKIREAILAMWAERIYSKQEILEMYLNQIPYGGSAYGIEEASKKYFDKSAKEISVSEAAFLAGLTKAPSTYSPYLNPEESINRRNEVLKNMLELGYISQEDYSTYKSEPLDIQPPKTYIRAPHFVFYVISQLEAKYGIRAVEEGGLRVKTTLDLDMQSETEKILSDELAKIQHLNVGNGAVLVTSPYSGEILTMVGSKDYFQEPYGAFNVTIAHRQPGSSIKPLMYSLALERNYTAASILQDSPVIFDIPGSKPYRPENYDGTYHGNVPLRYALANSYNIPAVRVLNTLGVSDFVNHGRKLGITTWDQPEDYGLSITLGGADVRMVDMAEAYGTFANYGEKVPVQSIISIEDYKGNKLESIERKPSQVLSPQTSFIISDILSDNYARQFAFGLQSDLFIPDHKVAVKTGTSNNKRDNWTIGYNRKYLTAVWVGNNDNSPMNPILTSGVTGASPIWHKVMMMVLNRNIPITADVQPASEFNEPEGLVKKQCYFGKDEYFRLGTENTDDCHQKVYNVSATPSPVE